MPQPGKSLNQSKSLPRLALAQEKCIEAIRLHQGGQLCAAKELYEAALKLHPRHADALHLLGVIAHQTGDHQRAVQLIDQAIGINSNNASFYSNKGIALKELRQLEAAIASFDKAIAVKPDCFEAYSNRGNAIKELGQLEAAIANYDKAIAIRPDYAEAYSNRGVALKEIGQLEAAVASYDKAIAIRPNYAAAYSNRGVALYELQQLEAAVVSFDKAIAIKPDFAEAYSNRGNALKDLRQQDAAIASYDQAIAIKPDYAEAYFNKSIALLLAGDFCNGWELYEWRWKYEKSGLIERKLDQPLWLGKESIRGKTILLYGEQGLGDTIQFCRYATLVAELGAKVVLEVERSLVGLLKTLEVATELIEKSGRLPNFDYHSPLLSLPLAFKTNLSSIPRNSAYLRSDPIKLMNWESRLGAKTKPRIGLVWSGSSGHKNDRNRSLTLHTLLSYLPESFEYICLQKELREIDLPVLEANGHIQFFGNEISDFADTAALCDLMDIVVSVDTSVAHLAGALGKETWIVLPYAPDWRWLLDRDDSPWYPSVRLYRQRDISNWDGALMKLQADLLSKFRADSTLKFPTTPPYP